MRGRSAYYQSSGGYGFRDQLQDSLACLPADPKITRSQLLLHAAHQFADGTVHHWWHPLTERGHHTEMTDDLLWLAYITLFYLKETKDFSILDEKAIYLDAPEGDLYDHCCRAIDKVFTRFSPRGLPLIGEGDWNDGMNMVGLHWKGESIWLGHFLYGILMDFSHICGLRNDTNRKSEYLNKAELLKKSINEYAWDGDWYLGATKDNGELMGSKQCKEGKIFLNAQSWAVFNDVATPERAKKCMESVERILDLKYGPLLATPAYTVPDETIGYVTRYAAGIRENGGVYTHGACWAIKAECYMKNNKRAYSMYSRISPVRRGLDPDMYRVEPYVTPGNTDGPESPFFGRGGWTWYTGSGAWLYNVSTDWILGIRATYEGLLIDPCIPREWPGYKARRVFRKAAYNIEVVNSRDGSGDIRCVELDGKKQKSNLIPDLSDNKTHEVKIIMGAKNDLAEKRTKKAELAKCN